MSLKGFYPSNEPQLVWVIEPETKVRFRYESEGGSHGGIAGKTGKKTYPTLQLLVYKCMYYGQKRELLVKTRATKQFIQFGSNSVALLMINTTRSVFDVLKNYSGRRQIIVRVSLHTEYDRPHVLEFKGKKNEGSKTYIEEPLLEDNTVVFKNLHILSKKKEAIEEILMDRRLSNLRDGMSQSARAQFEKKYRKDVKEKARAISNSVKLYFEAFEENKPDNILCSLYSDVICNQKAASKGDLRICRLSSISGTWKGGDEVILLCEKVQKDNIKVKFYEKNEDNNIIWEDYGVFSPLDVHYQVAIPFKTPPYRRNEEKTVSICLERNGETSDPREFTYKPDEQSSKKRKIDDSDFSLVSNTAVPFPDTPDSNNYCGSSSDNSNGASGGNFDFFLYDSHGFPINEDANIDDVDQVINIENIDDIDQDIDINDFLRALENIHEAPNDLQHPFNEVLQDSRINFDGGSDGLFTVKMEDQPVGQMGDFVDGFKKSEILFSQNLNTYSMDILDINARLNRVTLEGNEESENKIPDNSLKKKHFVSSSSDLQRKKKICSSLLLKRDAFGNTLLHRAVISNKNIIPILKMCSSLRVNLISAKNHKKQTALHIAAETNRCEAVKILLQCGSNPNLKDYKGNNCFFIAAYNNFIDVLCEINKFSRFPRQVCDINDEGLTPLHVTIEKKNTALFHLLKIHLTNPNIAERKAGKSLLHYAVQFLPSILIKLLEMPNVDVNIQDFEGNTPLHIACACTNVEAVKILLQYGADPTIKNYKQNFDNLDEISEDETSIGQLPSDLTTNLEILNLLKNAKKEVIEMPLNTQDPKNSEDVCEMPCQLTERLCTYLDEEMKWKKLALVFLDEEFIESLNLSTCPAKTLLNFIKKEDKDTYLERLKTGLEIAELRDAIDIINIYQHLNKMNVVTN